MTAAGHALDRLAGLYRWDVEPEPALRRALSFLGWQCSAETVCQAGYSASAVVGILSLLAVPLVPPPLQPGVATGLLAIAVAFSWALPQVPLVVATAKRSRALGAAPELVVLAVLRMRLSAAPERAGAFAAEAADGPLAASLNRHVREAHGTVRTGLGRFGSEWDEWFPALGRSLALVEAAAQTPAAERTRALDRALTVILEGTQEELQAFAGRIRGPVTGLYAFGVLLPTALVALLPAARAAGLPVGRGMVVLLYLGVVPTIITVAGSWLLINRPVAFPPPAVDSAHPAVAPRRLRAVLAGIVVSSTVLGLSLVGFPTWLALVTGVGAGVGAGLRVRFSSAVDISGNVRDLEEALPDALAMVGRQVAHGRSVESAIEHAGEELSGPLSAAFAEAATRQRQLCLGVRAAFLGEHGSLTAVPSSRVRGSVELLAVAAREGQPAGTSILALADHLAELQTVEAEARHDLRSICGTLQHTGALFGPLVAGATVALAESMGRGPVASGGAGAWIGYPIGVYALLLAVLLPALAVGLEQGFDRAVVGSRVGGALVLASGAFALAYVGAGLLA